LGGEKRDRPEGPFQRGKSWKEERRWTRRRKRAPHLRGKKAVNEKSDSGEERGLSTVPGKRTFSSFLKGGGLRRCKRRSAKARENEEKKGRKGGSLSPCGKKRGSPRREKKNTSAVQAILVRVRERKDRYGKGGMVRRPRLRGKKGPVIFSVSREKKNHKNNGGGEGKKRKKTVKKSEKTPLHLGLPTKGKKKSLPFHLENKSFRHGGWKPQEDKGMVLSKREDPTRGKQKGKKKELLLPRGERRRGFSSMKRIL